MTLQGTDQETGRQFAVIINFPQTLQPGTYPITKRAEVKNGGTVIYAHCQAIAPLQIFDSVGGELTLTECGEYYSGSFRLDAEDLGKKVTATGSFSKVIYTGR